MIDIANLLQTQAQTQIPVTGSNDTSQPGLFEGIMNELANINLDSNLELVDTSQVIMTQENNILPQTQPVMNLLASVNPDLNPDSNSQNPEVFTPEKFMMTQTQTNNQTQPGISATQAFIASDSVSIKPGELVSRILNDDKISAKITALPEEKLQELSNILEALQNSESDSEIETCLEKLFALLNDSDGDENLILNKDIPDSKTLQKVTDTPKTSHEIVNEPEDPDSDSDSDSESKAPELKESTQEINQFAGFGQVPVDNHTPDADNDSDKNISVNNNAPKRTQARITLDDNSNHEPVQAPDANNNESKTESRFNNVLNESENPDNDKNDKSENNQSQGSNQGSQDNSRENNTSRTRRVTQTQNNNQTQSGRTNSHRTESHSNFQSFFEGIMTSRRTNSQNISQPLNLRATNNFTQSSTLREGIVNVVRFIRSEGVHRASMIIDPPAIGRISVELTSSSSGVEASIKVASEQIRQLVQDQLTQLRMNLSEQGVQVAEFTVDVQQDNQQNQNNNHNNQENNYPGRSGAVSDTDMTGEPEEFRVDLTEGLLYWVA